MIVNQNGESSKSTKRKTTDHQQEKIKDEKNIYGQVDSDLGECLQKSNFHTG